MAVPRTILFESIMLSRWNHGYAYELCTTFDPSIFGPVELPER
jgi:hypothetical protein